MWILIKLTWRHYWDRAIKLLDFGNIDHIFNVTGDINVRNETWVFMNLYSIFVLPTDSIILRVYFNSQSSKVYKIRNLDTLLVVIIYFNILTEFKESY